MNKRAISKNYFHWEDQNGGFSPIFDKRIVEQFMADGRNPVDSAPEYNLDTKILIYEDRVKEWFLEIAKRLKPDNEAGFVILQVALSYIEGNQQYREGAASRGMSEDFFIKGMQRIFNLDNTHNFLLSEFYKQVRCGLFHDGMTRQMVTINTEHKVPLEFASKYIIVNPHSFLDAVEKDFEEYTSQLKDSNNKELRAKFEAHYNYTG